MLILNDNNIYDRFFQFYAKLLLLARPGIGIGLRNDLIAQRTQEQTVVWIRCQWGSACQKWLRSQSWNKCTKRFTTPPSLRRKYTLRKLYAKNI